MSVGWEVLGGVAVDDIGVLVDEGGTEVGAGEEEDGAGICEEVTGGNSDEVADDIGCDDAAVVALPVDVGGGLEEKSTVSSGGNKYTARTVRTRIRTAAHWWMMMPTVQVRRSQWGTSPATSRAILPPLRTLVHKANKCEHSFYPLLIVSLALSPPAFRISHTTMGYRSLRHQYSPLCSRPP